MVWNILRVVADVLAVPLREAEYVTATPLPLAKAVSVSGVRLPGPLSVALPVALRQRLGRSPPQHGEERGGAARRRRLQLLAVTHPYLIAGGARVGVGLIGRGSIGSCACCRVGVSHLETKKKKRKGEKMTQIDCFHRPQPPPMCQSEATRLSKAS